VAPSVLELQFWRYTTVVARATNAFAAVIGDAESVELGWIPVDEVAELPLHPGFADRWPLLRSLIETPVVVVVDSANVIGSRPNGWWRDRSGATRAFLSSLAQLSAEGISGASLELEIDRYWPRFVVVTEGLGRQADDPMPRDVPRRGDRGIQGVIGTPAVEVDRAPGEGDDRIVDVVRAAAAEGARVVVVTADARLRERVGDHGATTQGPHWLWNLIEL
jgi:8-oxo-dGTP diphosphatase